MTSSVMTEWTARLLPSGEQNVPLLLATLAAGTLVSEDLACISAGLLVASGTLGFPAAVAACFAGIFTGDLLLVLLGRTVGRRSLRAAPLRWWVSAEAVQRAERWFECRGPGLVLANRFMPGASDRMELAALTRERVMIMHRRMRESSSTSLDAALTPSIASGPLT